MRKLPIVSNLPPLMVSHSLPQLSKPYQYLRYLVIILLLSIALLTPRIAPAKGVAPTAGGAADIALNGRYTFSVEKLGYSDADALVSFTLTQPPMQNGVSVGQLFFDDSPLIGRGGVYIPIGRPRSN